MNDKSPKQSIQQALDSSLNQIDTKTQADLRAVRREALQTISQETVTSINKNVSDDVLSVSFFWKNKKRVSLGFGMALAISLMLVLVIPEIMPINNSQDFSSDFALYSEVDPEWLADLEVAEALGDE